MENNTTTQEEKNPRCSDCLTETEKKKVFSKWLYKCPNCSRSIDVTEPANESL